MSYSIIVFYAYLLLSNHGAIALKDGFVKGWVKSDRQLRFIKSDLYNYINGGAELFLEFGFEELFVQPYKNNGKEIDLEIYRMACPEAALGIYLMKCGTETPVIGIASRNTGNRFQYLSTKSSYFLIVNNFSGDESVMPVMVALLQRCLSAIDEGEPLQILQLLPQKNLIHNSERLIRGPYALQSIYTLGEGDILLLQNKLFAVVGDYRKSELLSYTLILIPYPSVKNALAAYNHLLSKLDSYIEKLEVRENGFLFKDYRNEFGVIQLKDSQLKIKIHFANKPDLEMEN